MDRLELAGTNTQDKSGMGMNRRTFLAGAAAATALTSLGGASAQSSSVDEIPVIDTHIHLFDGTRPLGAEYMGSPAYQEISKTSLPSMYSPQARPAGIFGAMVVESCSWIDENLWYLEMCRTDPIMIGVCGTLDTGLSIFGKYLEHLHQDPLFRAIRARIVPFYDEDNGKVRLKPGHVTNLKLLAEADLTLDTANPTMGLMRANVLLADAIPHLRIIMDHLPSFDPTPENQNAYEAVVKDMAARPNIFVKLTEVYHPRLSDGVVIRDYETLRTRLEYLYSAFGEDRVLFGSDYPNSYGVATIAEEVGLMKRFFSTKSRDSAEKYFWKNAMRIYKLKLT
ncbi:MAG TPA: amidohydrolase family protein [Terracidiphilus sp.]|nr:amidohydrolase family protein [Terracidiphilus sp.]